VQLQTSMLRLKQDVPLKHSEFLNQKIKVMAEQKGIIPLRGTIGNITFYKSKDGFMAREKGSLDANRIATDPAFQRTRENGAEFGRAGKAGKYLRTALRSLLQNVSDSRMIARLVKEMMRVIKADETTMAVHHCRCAFLSFFLLHKQKKEHTTLTDFFLFKVVHIK